MPRGASQLSARDVAPRIAQHALRTVTLGEHRRDVVAVADDEEARARAGVIEQTRQAAQRRQVILAVPPRVVAPGPHLHADDVARRDWPPPNPRRRAAISGRTTMRRKSSPYTSRKYCGMRSYSRSMCRASRARRTARVLLRKHHEPIAIGALAREAPPRLAERRARCGCAPAPTVAKPAGKYGSSCGRTASRHEP